MSELRFLYHIPSLDTIYAHRTIYNGFKNAIIDLGHEFRPFVDGNNLRDVVAEYRPNIFITASNPYYRRYLDYQLLHSLRCDGLFVLVKLDYWNSPMSRLRINEARSLRDDRVCRMLIDKDLLGDAFFHVVEQGDETMYGFNESTGRTYYTIPLAADKTISSVVPQKKFDCDVSYVGTNLPDKRQFFKNHMFPLRRNFDVKVYGQDWTRTDSAIGWIQRFGQFFNVPLLSKIRRPKLSIEDEASIYASSKISVNVHEAFQRRFGGDCNERTFKIPMCGGFEVVDNVECIKKYFKPGVELAIAENDSEWVEMVYYYLKNPDLRNDMVQRGKAKVLKDHTYHNRVNDIISLYNKRRLQ